MPAKKKPVKTKHAATPLQQITEFKRALKHEAAESSYFLTTC